MQFEELKEIQDFFLRTTQKNPADDIIDSFADKMGDIFVRNTLHRIEAYRTSYFARISSVFPETVFNLASCLFEKKFVAGLIVEYFLDNPTSLNMNDSLLDIPKYLEQNENIEECPFVPDFMRLCLIRDQVLASENPLTENFIFNSSFIPKPSEIFLQRNHSVIKSHWPLYQMYNVAREIEDRFDAAGNSLSEEISQEIEELRVQKFSAIQNVAESLLLYKSSACTLEVLHIPEEYISFVENMSEGKSLELSIENMQVDDNFDSEKFSSWIALLTQHKALVKGI
ncbi:hypothetical protein [Fluviispira sanaruensis]|uniref:DNA-binding domain-containing protein n=1 Tax=Fluviispira sanaruensis TaxID=2493639 RepID=A0A4P2VNF2_FLUSA|nr:hypothetical protein [Fluviispira sanaruensis]BBH53520.1 hypothetical protein JCM31447_19640 [Fluviispira sanaruensis]